MTTKDIARYHILKDGSLIASTMTHEQAIILIRQYQALEDHPILRANFSIIYGQEECISYPRKGGARK